MGRWCLALLALLACFGCSSGAKPARRPDPAPTVATKPGPPADPDRALYEQVKSGAYQISGAMDAIEQARKTAKDMAERETGNTKKALLAIAKNLDGAGVALSEYSNDPPPFAEFKTEFAAQDDRRLKAIDACGDVLDNLNDTQDIVAALLKSNPPEPEKTQLDNASSDLDGCIGAVEDSIKAMGGKVD
ncbi:MAG: hypothetical protein P4L46_03655 [Fimbriimonas sp.]|nr:hypothetical protein [Fimbriimonas sp.]